jgi:hypothetical protein
MPALPCHAPPSPAPYPPKIAFGHAARHRYTAAVALVFPDSQQEAEIVRAVARAARALVNHAAIGLSSEGLAVVITRSDGTEVCAEVTVRWFQREAAASTP